MQIEGTNGVLIAGCWQRDVASDVASTRRRPAYLGITSVYLEGIDAGELVETVHGRRAPLIPAVTALGQ